MLKYSKLVSSNHRKHRCLQRLRHQYLMPQICTTAQ
nr:MAG TPA_asm: hypothetical protein [Caudoviricetes sp.]DAW87805.1 MAG TPA: hypothetical protein [Caudoviricetes sp.]